MWRLGWWADLQGLTFDESSRSGWIHAMRPGTFTHPVYGKIEFTMERLKRFADGVTNRVRGIDLDIDYDHKQDPAHGGEAAGWIKAAQVRDDGLWVFVEWTEKAFSALKDKAYRYFSPEYRDEWTDPQGNKFQDVLFGGGITNRPYMKDLVPINLSELSFIPEPPAPNQEVEVDLKKLREILGLAADTPEAEVYKVFGERLQPIEPPKNDPPKNDPPKNDPPTPPVIQLSEELKQLAEKNPVVKSLLEAFEGQTRAHANMAKALREAEIGKQLSELDKSKLVITPAAKELIHDIAIELDEKQAEKFWQLMQHMHTSQSFLVELGERAGSGVKYGRDKSASQVFGERTSELVTKGMTYPDAVEQVAREDPKLYDEYRNENFSFKA